MRILRQPSLVPGALGMLVVLRAARRAGAERRDAAFLSDGRVVWRRQGSSAVLASDARQKKERWREHVRQIKALGFNTVRCPDSISRQTLGVREMRRLLTISSDQPIHCIQ